MTTAYGPVRSPVRGSSGDDEEITPPTPTLTATALTATSGSSVTASVGDNAIEVPADYSELIVTADPFALTQGKLILHVKVDSTTTEVHLYPYQSVAIKNVAGKTVAFGAQTVAKNSLSATNATFGLKVIPTRGKAHAAPTGDIITIHPDQCPPNLWQLKHAHVSLEDEYQTIQVQPSTYRRDLFMYQFDGVSSIIGPTHIHLPANQTVNIDCRHRALIFANISGETVDIKFPPSAAEVDNTSTKWAPEFTPTAATTVSTVAGLKAAMNGSTYDDILLSPGTYDMSASGDKMNGTNYSAAMSRTLRIRSTTGNPADVTFTGAPWIVSLASGSVSWVLQGVGWNLDGVDKDAVYTAMVNFDGKVHLSDFKYYGANAGGGDITSISWRSNSTVGAIEVYAAWGDVQKSLRDNITCNSLNSQAALLHLIGTYVDGNGSNSNDQLITCHTTGSVAAWGCRFGNLTTGNLPRCVSDGPTSHIHLNYCYSRDSDFGAVGLSVNGVSAASPSGTFLLFCDFPKMSGMYYVQYAVGSYAAQTSTNGPLVFTTPTTMIAGCDLYGKAASATGFERLIFAYQQQVTILGSRLTHGFGIANQNVLQISDNTTGNKVATLRNVLMRALATVSGSNILSVGGNGSGGTHSIDFKNVLIDTDGSMGISATAAASLSDGCRFKRAAAPTNWASKVTAGTNTFSTAALDLDANDTPILDGNCDEGIDPGFVGGIDIYGRPFLGGVFVEGCVERTTVRSGAFLFPLVWTS